MENTNQKLRKVLASALESPNTDFETLAADANLCEHGMDSITSINIIVEIEEAFDIAFDESDLLIENINSINKLEGIINRM